MPNIGAVISAVPPMIQVLLFNGIYECILVGALFLVVHMVIGNILEPRMMGHRLGVFSAVDLLAREHRLNRARQIALFRQIL